MTTSSYVALNRITSSVCGIVEAGEQRHSYSDPTPPVTYSYDTAPLGKGRLASISSSVSTTSYDAYDALGRIRQSSQVTEGQTYSFSYTYNRADRMTSQTYPSGLMVATEYDEAGRVAGVRRGSSTYYYAGAAPSDPKRIGYAAHGAVTSRPWGNGLREQVDFNSRVQPIQIRLRNETAMQNVVNLGYDFGTTNNNGNILGQTIAIEIPPVLTLSQTYTYDSLNRLATASETNSWSQTYGYDRYGNRWVAAGAQYSNDPALTPTLQTDFDSATNRLTGSSYDAAGNLTVDATARTFGYDAENRQISFNGGQVEYFYDGEGRRVKKVAGGEITVYVYNSLGQLVAEYTNGPDPGTGHKYVTADHLGSTRVVTDQAGQVLNRYDYLPFGEEIAAAYGNRSTVPGYGFPDTVKHKFTGKERDSESGLDNFQFRYNSSSLGRFMSPDPFMASGRVENPQTWNRYTYALNNPLRFIDPLGLFASPAYNCSDANQNCLNDEQRRILENSTVEIDGKKLSGEELYNALGETRQNAFVNITDRLASITLADGSTVLSALESITSFQEDRVFANVNLSLAESISKDSNFKEVFFFKSQHPGADVSFKSREKEGSIQFSFNKARTVADIDHDLKNTFFAHLLEAARNAVTDTRTDQDQVRRLLIANPKVGITPSPDPKFNRPQ